MKKIKVFSMFSGYGGDLFALQKAGIDHECVGCSEIDPFAIKCHDQNHKVKNYGDCTKIDPDDLPDFDLLTGGFPCQAFSISGKRGGFDDTRGTLFNEIIRIAKVKRPKYLLVENVKGLTNHDNGKTMKVILNAIKKIGYGVIYKVLNSKDYGTPQNRERIFFVCKFGGWDFMEFQFPNKEKLKLSLRDILEHDVDKKYYLSEKMIKGLLKPSGKYGCFQPMKPKRLDDIATTISAGCCKMRRDDNYIREQVKDGINQLNDERQGKRVYGTDGISPTLTSHGDSKGGIPVPFINQLNNPKHSNDRIYGDDGISPTLNTMQGGNRQPNICINHVGDIQVKATKRTFDTPKEINQFLKDNKGKSTMSDMADRLRLPKTQVEHYFRVDQSRAVPSPEIWNRLKDILEFDDTYDRQVTSIYEKEVEFESSRRVYGSDGLSPTLDATAQGKMVQVHNMQPRSPDRPPLKYSSGGSGHLQRDDIAYCVDTGNTNAVEFDNMTIRRLVPIECFRLQGFFKDEISLDNLSDSQRYKLAGNGWELSVVSKIFKNMFKKI